MSPKKRKQPNLVIVDRLDLEAFDRDLGLISKWCRQSLYELAQADRGRSQWPTITKAMSAAATWRGRLAVVLRYNPDYASDPTATPLRLLASDVSGWDDETPEPPAPPAARRSRPCHRRGA